jgi:hypothetical protein
MPQDGQPGIAKDGTPVVWVASLNRAIPVAAAKAFGVRPRPNVTAGGEPVDAKAFSRARDTITSVDDAKKRTNWFRTGFVGGLTKDIPGSPAYNLDKDMDTLKARAGFDELAAMRKASPTGAALGSIAVRELDLLTAADANLDIGQGEEQIDKNLDRLRQSTALRNPGVSTANPFDLSRTDRSQIPEGAFFRGPDGKVYRQKRGAGFPVQGAPPVAKFDDSKEARYQAWLARQK